MHYPILISVAEAAKLLSIGRTSIYARLNDGSLKAAKFGSSTRITFSSLIDYTLRCLKEGNGNGEFSEIFGDAQDVKNSTVAEKFAARLCNTHSEPTDIRESDSDWAQSAESTTNEAGSPKKNFRGEI